MAEEDTEYLKVFNLFLLNVSLKNNAILVCLSYQVIIAVDIMHTNIF